MGVVKKESKDEIVKLMLQEVPTEEIARRLNYSVSTIRKVFEELRDEYGVNSKMGIAVAYLRDKISEHLTPLLNLSDSGNFAMNDKPALKQEKRQNFYKKRKKQK